MAQKNYTYILYFITIVILVTLGIQVYWNLKNYQASKQQLINEVQISLDNAVDQYYEGLAFGETFDFVSENNYSSNLSGNPKLNFIFKGIDSIKSHFINKEYSDSTKVYDKSFFYNKKIDSIKKLLNTFRFSDSCKTIIDITGHNDLILEEISPLESLTSKIIISISEDELDTKTVDSLFKIELARKNISINYNLSYKEDLDIANPKKSKTHNKPLAKGQLYTKSKSSYLPQHGSLGLFFSNTTRTLLKKNLLGILLSFLLVTSVIGCLLYLLKIIKHQKQLAELKNDLISNITHEFKTPIATISAALEGVQSFNHENDPEKTQKYVAMSSTQLTKLNTMVEKILETATLDNDELQLNLEEINLVTLIDGIVKKHKTNSPEKKLTYNSSHDNIWKKADVFHIENAINNILDNAIKYGGDTIFIAIKNLGNTITIEVKDTGTSLSKNHKEKIFEKFYRVPKGNTHDVKGFGIGLFYTKTIIEKHAGTIQLQLDQKYTNFKINLPNG